MATTKKTTRAAAQNRVRSKLQTSETRYRRLFETAPDGMLILDARSRKITDVNPFMVALLGYSRNEFLGKELWEIGILRDRQASRSAFRALQQKGYLRYDHLALQTKDGERREVEFISNLYKDGPRSVVQCNIRDLTDRQRAEEALREMHRRLSFHVENTPLAVIEWDANFRLSRWSPSAERIFGWNADEVLGKRINDWRFVYTEDIKSVEEVMWRQLLGLEQHGVSRNRNHAKDGSVLQCEWYNSVLRDSDGKLQSVLSLVLDVTARKQAENERADLLQREQEARREAEEANRSKDEFLATLSHELRAPLASILGWARLLSSEMVEKEKYPQVFETIARNAKSQAQLIDDLLDVSRIITGKLRLEVRPVKLAAVIESTIDTVRPAAQAKDIRFEVLLDRNVGQISGDPDRLQQLMWNLVSNAIKFTPTGGHVQIRLSRRDSHAEITVSDSGQGIDPEFLPHVFERFRQADGSSSRKYGGLGLGLAIVRHLTELHGGMVAVENNKEAGATFKVKLPLAARRESFTASGASPDERRRVSRDPSLKGLTLKGLKVLIVDDEPDVRKFTTMMFEQFGAKATAAASSAEAVEMLARWKPDVLVADIGMPDEDGYVLIQRVRSLPAEKGGRTPALALTAYARTEDRVRILSAGFQIHVSKPVEPAELIAAVASLAGRTVT